MGYSFRCVLFSDGFDKVSCFLLTPVRINAKIGKMGKQVMIMKDRTKWEYSHTLIEMMKHKSLQKITVRELCGACDARPQNFYYHFRDKYDLVTWIYAQDIEAVCNANTDKPWSAVLRICYENMQSRRAFYKNAFTDDFSLYT